MRIGLYLAKPDDEWLDTPFWRSSFLLTRKSDIEKMLEHGYKHVWIDVSKGHDFKPPAVQREDAPEHATAFVRPNALIGLVRLKTKNDYTYMHSVAVSALMIALARQLGTTASRSNDWNGKLLAKTRRWPERPPCWYCKKCAPCGKGVRKNDLFGRTPAYPRYIGKACANGATLQRACKVAGISLNCWYRWQHQGVTVPDRQPQVPRSEPANKLSMEEHHRILAVCNSARFGSLPPSHIAPMLADEGCYLASESSFYRVLRQAGQAGRRGRAVLPRTVTKPTSHTATAPNQV